MCSVKLKSPQNHRQSSKHERAKQPPLRYDTVRTSNEYKAKEIAAQHPKPSRASGEIHNLQSYCHRRTLSQMEIVDDQEAAVDEFAPTARVSHECNHQGFRWLDVRRQNSTWL